MVVYFGMVLLNERKGKYVDMVLPDMLDLLAINLRGGVSISEAMLQSNRVEFGPLSKEIEIIGNKVAYGTDFETALYDMSKRIKSDGLKRAVELIVFAMNSGSNLSELASSMADNLRQQEIVTSEIKKNVSFYVYFIIMAVAMIAPLLYSMSSVLVGVIERVISGIEVTNMPGMFGGSINQEGISEKFVFIFGLLAMITTQIMAGLTIGLITEGKKREGLKYIPFMLIVSLVIFFAARTLIKGFLGDLIP